MAADGLAMKQAMYGIECIGQTGPEGISKTLMSS